MLSAAGHRMLDDVAWRGQVWWHDLDHPTRSALLRQGLLRSSRVQPGCCTHGLGCPGYVEVSDAGLRALALQTQ